MLKKGNGNIIVCANNLVAMAQGECPFDRLKGIPSDSIDGPSTLSTLDTDIELMVEEYEPRISVEQISKVLNRTDQDATIYINTGGDENE